MKKFLLLIVLIGLSVAIGYTIRPQVKSSETGNIPEIKREILRFAILSDSSGENQLLGKALLQAKGAGVNFIVGLGDWTTVGTSEQLTEVKTIFDESGFTYYVIAGDHDVWDSRDKQSLRSSTSSAGLKGFDALTNFREVFGNPNRVIERNGVKIVLLDNSDIYSGIDSRSWEFLNQELKSCILRADNESEISNFKYQISNMNKTVCFVMAHKTPFHPDTQHIMGAQSAEVAKQAKMLLDTLINSNVSGFFSGDIHFFAQFSAKGGSASGGKSPDGKLPITTVGAIGRDKNFQGPRFVIVKVFNDYTWEVDDVEIR